MVSSDLFRSTFVPALPTDALDATSPTDSVDALAAAVERAGAPSMLAWLRCKPVALTNSKTAFAALVSAANAAVRARRPG